MADKAEEKKEDAKKAEETAAGEPEKSTALAKTGTTKLTKSEADKNWNDAIEHFKKRECDTLIELLTMYWERGEFLEKLSKAPDHYGGRVILNFAEALDVSESSAYYYYSLLSACIKSTFC